MLSTLLGFVPLWASVVTAQAAVDSMSFGHNPSQPFSLSGWTVLGDGYVPQLMSDKVILTPPYGGNKRGAVWTEATNTLSEWQATVEFRAGGVDNGKANMQVWYVKDGRNAVGTSSIYTVGKFDGLALVIDMTGGIQKIRGFLNDGTTDYSSHNNVDGLAFGHCNYIFRNRGLSKLVVKASAGGLDVTIDDQACFSTDKVTLPATYGFGLTAASADPPDSFEAFKFELVPSSSGRSTSTPEGKDATNQINLEHHNSPIAGTGAGASTGFSSSDHAYQALDQRLTTLTKSISSMFGELNRHTAAEEQRFNEIISLLKNPPPSSGSDRAGGNMPSANAAITQLQAHLTALDKQITELSGHMQNSMRTGLNEDHFRRISEQIQETHHGIHEHLPGRMREYIQSHTPRIGFIVFSFMLFQSACLGVLMWQKWRKGTMPKKFL